MLKRQTMKPRTSIYALAGVGVIASSRQSAVQKFRRLGFAEHLARALVKPVTSADKIPFNIVEV